MNQKSRKDPSAGWSGIGRFRTSELRNSGFTFSEIGFTWYIFFRFPPSTCSCDERMPAISISFKYLCAVEKFRFNFFCTSVIDCDPWKKIKSTMRNFSGALSALHNLANASASKDQPPIHQRDILFFHHAPWIGRRNNKLRPQAAPAFYGIVVPKKESQAALSAVAQRDSFPVGLSWVFENSREASSSPSQHSQQTTLPDPVLGNGFWQRTQFPIYHPRYSLRNAFINIFLLDGRHHEIW